MDERLGIDPLKRSLFKRTEGLTHEESAERPDDMKGAEGPPQTDVLPSTTGEEKETPKGLQIVSFHYGNIAFGARIDQVASVVRMVEITSTPSGPDFFEGIINVRGQIVPVLSLGKMFRLSAQERKLDMRIVIGEVGDRRIGIMVDGVSDVFEINAADITPASPNIPLGRLLLGVAMLREKLMFVLDFDRILSFEEKSLITEAAESPLPMAEVDDAMTKRLSDAPERGDDEVPKEEDVNGDIKRILHERAVALSKSRSIDREDVKQLVAFSLGSEYYGIDISEAEKICRAGKVAATPSTPDYVLGMMNLGGDILWVLDVKRIFGLTERGEEEQKRIVIFKRGETRFGFVADAVLGVIDLPVSRIEPPLTTIEKVKADYIDGEAQWNDGLIGIINSGRIIESIASAEN